MLVSHCMLPNWCSIEAELWQHYLYIRKTSQNDAHGMISRFGCDQTSLKMESPFAIRHGIMACTAWIWSMGSRGWEASCSKGYQRQNNSTRYLPVAITWTVLCAMLGNSGHMQVTLLRRWHLLMDIWVVVSGASSLHSTQSRTRNQKFKWTGKKGRSREGSRVPYSSVTSSFSFCSIVPPYCITPHILSLSILYQLLLFNL